MENQKEPTMTIRTGVEVPISRVQDMLCSAFEGGSNYWYRIEKFVEPKDFKNKVFGTSFTRDEVFKHIDYPTNEGGALEVSDFKGVDGDEEAMVVRRLDLQTIAEGLETMAKKYPRHFADMMSENDDADTGDVFLQCCLFKEVIFG